MSRLTPVLLACALALSLYGCGGGSSEPSTSAFKSEFSAQKAQLKTLGEDVRKAVEGASKKTDEELAVEFKDLAARATTLAGALGQLNAPKKYKAALGTLQSSVTQVAGTLHSIEAASAAHDSTAAQAGGETIIADALQVESDDEALSTKLGLKTNP